MIDPRFASAVQGLQAGKLAEAVRQCRAAPNDAPGIHLLGFVAHKAGRQEAIELIGAAIAVDETNPDLP
jgi:hypothetical protein